MHGLLACVKIQSTEPSSVQTGRLRLLAPLEPLPEQLCWLFPVSLRAIVGIATPLDTTHNTRCVLTRSLRTTSKGDKYFVQIINNYGLILRTVRYHVILVTQYCNFYIYELVVYFRVLNIVNIPVWEV